MHLYDAQLDNASYAFGPLKLELASMRRHAEPSKCRHENPTKCKPSACGAPRLLTVLNAGPVCSARYLRDYTLHTRVKLLRCGCVDCCAEAARSNARILQRSKLAKARDCDRDARDCDCARLLASAREGDREADVSRL